MLNTPFSSSPAPFTAQGRVSAHLAALFAAGALAACGGGGGASSAPTPAPAPVPAPAPAPASDYFVYGLSSTAMGNETLNVVDPASTAGPVLTSSYTASAATPLFTVAMTFNASTRAYTRLGAPLVFFVRDKQLFRIALSKPGTPAEVRVSSQADVCALAHLAQLDASGLDAWLWIQTAGADGDCSTVLDNTLGVVRSSASSSTPATLLPVNNYVAGSISDASGTLLWMLVNDRSTAGAFKLVAYDPALTRVDVAGGAGISSAAVIHLLLPGLNPALADGVYLRADSQLRRLSGTASALSLAASSYAFTSTSSGLGMSDGTDFYFPDGNKLVKIAGTGTPAVLATLPVANGSILSLAQTPSRVITHQLATTTTITSAISKADGTVLQLLAGDALTSIRNPMAILGEALYYSTGSASKLGDVRRVQVDGTGDALVLAGVYPAGAVSRTAGRADFTQLFFSAGVSLLTCTPASGAADCRTGALQQFDLATQTSTVLGSFVTNAAPAWTVSALGWDGQAGMVVSAFGASTATQTGYTRRDLWLASPGVANSLRRVTSTMP